MDKVVDASDNEARRSKFSFPPVNLEKAYDIIDAMQAVAKRRDATVAQVALSWLLHQPSVTSVIIGAKNANQLKDNLGSVALKLDAEDLKQLDEVSRLTPEYPGWMITRQSANRMGGQYQAPPPLPPRS